MRTIVTSNVQVVAVVVFGNTNDTSGQLSDIAISRANYAFEIHKNIQNSILITTGGQGEHFNTTETPHAELLCRYLKTLGVSESRILQSVNGNNTLTDVRDVGRILRTLKRVQRVEMVTSLFHLERVKFIVNHFGDIRTPTVFHGVDFPVDAVRLTQLDEHERSALAKLRVVLNDPQ